MRLSRGIRHCLHMFEGVLSVLDAGSGVYATLVPPSTYSVISVTTCARILRRTIFLALISIVYSYGIIWLHITAGTFTTQWQTVSVPAIFYRPAAAISSKIWPNGDGEDSFEKRRGLEFESSRARDHDCSKSSLNHCGYQWI